MKININKNICDFKLVSSKDVKEINSVCHIFNDNITGAKLLYTVYQQNIFPYLKVL